MLPVRLEAQCTAPAPTQFEPNPPGPARPGSLAPAFNSNLALFQNGAGGSWRILMQESFGYSVLDLANPANPTAVRWDDLRFDPANADSNPIPGGGGLSYVQTVAASLDGQRAAFSMNGAADSWLTLVGRPDGNNGFGVWGSFFPNRASGVVIQQAGSRYIAYALHASVPATAADVTTLPTTLAQGNLAYETTNWPPGNFLSMAGNFVVYTAGNAIQVIDISNPGPAGSITSAFQQKQITSTNVPAFGGRTPMYPMAAVDPGDSRKLWVLVELAPAAGENSPSYGLVSITKDPSTGNLSNPVAAGPVYRIPALAGETWINVGPASALVSHNGQIYVLMWANRHLPSFQLVLYSTTISAWGNATPMPIANPNFRLGTTMNILPGSGSTIYAYIPSGLYAWVLPLTCQAPNTKATSSLAVTNAGVALSDGGTAFIGDTLTILPTVLPSPVPPLLDWRFDFDFHPLPNPALEDNGTSPRINHADIAWSAAQTAPPAPVTYVGPCDPAEGGTPSSGAGCWDSVTKPNAIWGGPDFTTPTPAAGTQVPLKIALEATNTYGIANTAVFTVNWKVPAVRLASTQVLSGQPLVSASDGHPSGYKWYFGTTANNLLLAPGCTDLTTCVPTAGTSFYWLTATYANGYVTPDYNGTTNVGQPFTVTSFVAGFLVNGVASGPITVYTFQTLTVVNNSQRGLGISATYQYYLCTAPCVDSDLGYVGWAMGDTAGANATIPVPTVGNYILRIKANYTGGTARWPDPVSTPNGFPITVSNAPPPIVVTVGASPNPANSGNTVTLSCSATGGSGSGYNYSWSGLVGGPFSTSPTYSFTASNHTGSNQTSAYYCSVTDSAGGQGSNAVNLTVHPAAAQALVVTASATPNPAYHGNVVQFSCQATGGSGAGYSFAWPVGAGTITSPTFTITANNGGSTDIIYSATCAVTDSAGASSSSTVNLTIHPSAGGPPPGPACTTVDFAVRDVVTNTIVTRASNLGIQYYQMQRGQNLQFEANGTYTSYSWTFGDGGTSTAATPSHAYAAGGNFTASLTATGNSACAAPASYLVVVTGPTGQFTAVYEDESSITYSKVTAFKNIVFTAHDVLMDSYLWDFGDDTLPVIGSPATHSFAPGSWIVKLTVTKDLAPVTTTLALTILPPPEPPKWFVAGMAYLQGSLAGTLWQTDVTILNPDPTHPAAYSVAFLDGRNFVEPKDLVWTSPIQLDPQHSIGSPNVLALLGKPLGSWGALLVRGDVAPVAPVITSRTFNNGDPTKGTFGLSVPSTQASSGVSPQASAAQQLLVGLRDDTTAYTNVGLVNLSTDWSHDRLTFLDRSGATSLGEVIVDVPPYGVAQLTRPLAATPPSGVGFPDPLDPFSVKVTVLSGGAVFPYATVIDRRSTDSIAVTVSDRPSSTYRMPGIIRLQGANNAVWRSRFYITNPSTTSRKATISYSFVPCDATGCKARVTGLKGDVTLLPGETLWADDFPKVWLAVFGFEVSDTTAYQASYVDVYPAEGDENQEPLIVLGETYNDQPAGPVGLQVPGFTDADAASKTGAYKRLLLAGLVSNATYRTNVALFLQSGTSGRCTVRVLSDTGVDLAHQGIEFGGTTTFVQLNDPELFGSLPGNKDRLTVVIDSFEGSPISAYATIVDNTSGDATFLKAQPAP